MSEGRSLAGTARYRYLFLRAWCRRAYEVATAHGTDLTSAFALPDGRASDTGQSADHLRGGFSGDRELGQDIENLKRVFHISERGRNLNPLDQAAHIHQTFSRDL